MTGQFSTQWSKATLEKERKMSKHHFKLWAGEYWKCYHCPKKVESIREAWAHFVAYHRWKFRK